MSFNRYAIYYLPEEPDLAGFGARWLGWDVETGRAVAQPDVAGIDDITMSPRKYGFHGTLKPPFRLAEGRSLDGLLQSVADLAASCAPATCEGLTLNALGRFLALTPRGDAAGIGRIAAVCVEVPDGFRAAPDEAEIVRRRKPSLSDRQVTMLTRWGYPYLMEEFRFHLTLTGRLRRAELADWTARVGKALPPLPAPFVMGAVAVVGEREQTGCFELIQRFALTG